MRLSVSGREDGVRISTLRAVAMAICKSATCEGINCCQWPSNGGRRRDPRGGPAPCNVANGAYDDAAKNAIAALQDMSYLPTPFDGE